jgi:dephospho-CoA kinase
LSKVYGLTGGIASGKSTVSKMLRSRGLEVVDADQIARDVVAPGTPGLRAVTEKFGDTVLAADGGLDRGQLASIVFSDPDKRRSLEDLLHPLIASASLVALAEAAQRGPRPIFYDAALLVENGRQSDFAGLVVIACTRDTQLGRIKTRDSLTKEEAEARISAQLPLSQKVDTADFVIWNDGSIDELEASVDELLHQLENG